MEIQEKRKTYSLSAEASKMLAQTALDLSAETKKHITKQTVLDFIVEKGLADKKTKVLLVKKIKNERA